jgi:D-glycero-alpha-D-manno-heptose 1-phosphate guanylyltransferase
MNLELNQVVAVVLAGGFGTRVAHLLPGIPKPMAQVAGRPFLEWVVRFLARQRVENIILSTGHLAEVVEEHFRNNPVPGARIRCIAETQPLGTAGGFLNAARLSGEKPPAWLVLNGDSLVLSDLAVAARELADASVAGVLVGCLVPDASRYGTLDVGADGRLRGFAEKRPGRGAINAGNYLLRGGLVDGLSGEPPLSFETDVFPRLIRENVTLKVLEVDAPFLDIGTPDSLRQAEEFVKEHRSQFGE